VAEGGGLLNRYTLQRRIKGSNPFVSANLPAYIFDFIEYFTKAQLRALANAPARSMGILKP
jgi:hypothetical protein